MVRPSAVSVHEAAHAVVTHQLGLKAMGLEKINDDEGFSDNEHPECPVTAATIILAGHEAEILWLGQDPKMFPAEDLKNLEQLGVSITGCNIVRDPIIKFLRSHKKLIWSVAHELDKRKKVSRRLFLKLVRENS